MISYGVEVGCAYVALVAREDLQQTFLSCVSYSFLFLLFIPELVPRSAW